MNKLIIALAATALSTTLAFAQTTNSTTAAGATTGVNGSGNNPPAVPDTSANTAATNTLGVNGSGNNPPPGTKPNANTTDVAKAGTANETKEACNSMLLKAHPGSSTEFSDSESAPFLGKMSSMKMSTKTSGKLTSEEFLTACEAGTFAGM